MLNKEMKNKKGFTLIELLVVIAIIGILSGVVMVSTKSAVDKSKRASALTTVASALPELATCQDDGGEAADGTPVISTSVPICCASSGCPTVLDGHNVNWPDLSSTGWNYNAAVSGSVTNGDYAYSISNAAGTDTITCSLATNGCV